MWADGGSFFEKRVMLNLSAAGLATHPFDPIFRIVDPGLLNFGAGLLIDLLSRCVVWTSWGYVGD